jgi:hypothetical protein
MARKTILEFGIEYDNLTDSERETHPFTLDLVGFLFERNFTTKHPHNIAINQNDINLDFYYKGKDDELYLTESKLGWFIDNSQLFYSSSLPRELQSDTRFISTEYNTYDRIFYDTHFNNNTFTIFINLISDTTNNQPLYYNSQSYQNGIFAYDHMFYKCNYIFTF